MEPSKVVVPVTAVRERVIQQLSDAFAHDLITVDELEDRLARAYAVTTAAEAEALVVGLAVGLRTQSAAAVERGDEPAVVAPERFRSILSSWARRGAWLVPRHIRMLGLFSDST